MVDDCDLETAKAMLLYKTVFVENEQISNIFTTFAFVKL